MREGGAVVAAADQRERITASAPCYTESDSGLIKTIACSRRASCRMSESGDDINNAAAALLLQEELLLR